jgi:DNA polymerase-3 subunit delta'
MALLKDSIRGHREVFEFWNQFLSLEKPSATFALVGADGVGKRKVAWAMMQQALCANSPITCGDCSHCLRIAKGQHESVLWISPQTEQIKIDQARQVLDFLSLQSLTKKRFVVLERAEALNQQAANSLLKILEEPPAGTVFFLLTTNPAALLPTIRSRCLMLRFRPLTVEQLRSNNLNRGSSSSANASSNSNSDSDSNHSSIPDWILQASRGSFSRMAQLSSPETQAFRLAASSLLLAALLDENFLTVPEWRIQVKDREFFREVWPFWMELLRDTIAFKWQRSDLLTCPDQMTTIERLAAIYSELDLDDILLRVVQTARDLSIPRDPQLVMEQFFCRE